MRAILTDAAGKLRYAVECIAIAHRQRELVYLEIASRSNQAARAIWANIVKARKGKNLAPTEISTGPDDIDAGSGERLYVMPGTKYHHRELIETDTNGQTVHRLIIITSEADRLHREYISGGSADAASPYFTSTIQQFVDVPFLPAWSEQLWKEGLKKGLIRGCAGQRCSWHHIIQAAESWQNIVSELYKRGELTAEPRN